MSEWRMCFVALTMRRNRAVPRDQSDLDPAVRADPAQAAVDDAVLL